MGVCFLQFIYLTLFNAPKEAQETNPLFVETPSILKVVVYIHRPFIVFILVTSYKSLRSFGFRNTGFILFYFAQIEDINLLLVSVGRKISADSCFYFHMSSCSLLGCHHLKVKVRKSS